MEKPNRAMAQIGFKFQICKVKFYATSFWRHMSTVHAPDEKLVYSCDTCGRKFPHLFRLRMHEKTHLAYDKVRSVRALCKSIEQA